MHFFVAELPYHLNDLPHSHLMPSLGVNPFEFLDELFNPKTRVLALFAGEDFVILACVVFTQCYRVTDGQTDGRTDGETDNPIVANTGLCIASYADALQKLLQQAPKHYPLGTGVCPSPVIYRRTGHNLE